jgi:phenylacetate-CoA ligase
VNVFPTQVEELVLKIAQLAPHYQIVLTKNGNLDEVEVMTEVRPEFDYMNDTERAQLGAQLRHAIKSFIGISAAIRVTESGKVERSLTGKARRVIDRRSH